MEKRASIIIQIYGIKKGCLVGQGLPDLAIWARLPMPEASLFLVRR